jgi:two-component system, OmpR family, phosphate regulon sensor histidine kinase PhoR
LNGITQGKIAFIVSLFLLFFQWFGLLFIYYLVDTFPKYIFLIPLISSVLIFFSILILIEYFILGKIRILYRTFLSIGKKIDRNSIQDPELFEKLSIQLNQFRLEKSIEIDRLKENEIFRKEFISNVSHELKTPLTSIQGFVELLISAVKSNEKIELNYLEKIYKNSDRLIEIVQDLTTISQAEHRQLNLKLEEFDIYNLFEEVIESLEEMAKAKKIKLEFKDINITAFWVKADRAKLSQVIFNLLENAIYYCPEKSKIQIRLTDIDQHILIEILDNGPGISPEHLPRIFERFYRIDENRSREKGGSGLGLSIVKNILEAHEQPIHVESMLGKGTKFFFSLART